MSTTYTQSRSNYFRVRDLAVFTADLKRHGIALCTRDDARPGDLYYDAGSSDEPENSLALFVYDSWPTPDDSLRESEQDAIACDFFKGADGTDSACVSPRDVHYSEDFPSLVAQHLIDGDVAVFESVHLDRMRSMGGSAVAINSRNEREEVSLWNIYDLADSLGNTVTRALY